MADYTTRPPTTLDPASQALLPTLRTARLAVLCAQQFRKVVPPEAISSRAWRDCLLPRTFPLLQLQPLCCLQLSAEQAGAAVPTDPEVISAVTS
jgi:hypothetical protein